VRDLREVLLLQNIVFTQSQEHVFCFLQHMLPTGGSMPLLQHHGKTRGFFLDRVWVQEGDFMSGNFRSPEELRSQRKNAVDAFGPFSCQVKGNVDKIRR